MSVPYKPEGYHNVTAYLIVKDPEKALAYYAEAFGAKEVMKMQDPSGAIVHAEFQIGDSKVMMAGEFPDMGVLSPQSIGGSPVSFCIYVEDCDQIFQKAIAAGGAEKRPLQDQFYGDRSGTLEDPFGHTWTIATHTGKTSPPPWEQT